MKEIFKISVKSHNFRIFFCFPYKAHFSSRLCVDCCRIMWGISQGSLKHLFQNSSPNPSETGWLYNLPAFCFFVGKHLLKEMVCFWQHDQDCALIAGIVWRILHKNSLKYLFNNSTPLFPWNRRFYEVPSFCFLIKKKKS